MPKNSLPAFGNVAETLNLATKKAMKITADVFIVEEIKSARGLKKK